MLPSKGIIESKLIAEKLNELSKKLSVLDLNLKKNKKESKDLENLTDFLNKSLEYEEKERICGSNRNSFYKLDHDASAMCMKEDYYSGVGSNMHAAYNTQICVSHGFVTSSFISQNRTDLYDFIPTLKQFHSMCNYFLESVCADARYVSDLNSSFMKENNIQIFVKYFTWEGNVSGRNPSQYALNDNDTITCLNGNLGYPFKDTKTHHRKKIQHFIELKVVKIVIIQHAAKDL